MQTKTQMKRIPSGEPIKMLRLPLYSNVADVCCSVPPSLFDCLVSLSYKDVCCSRPSVPPSLSCQDRTLQLQSIVCQLALCCLFKSEPNANGRELEGSWASPILIRMKTARIFIWASFFFFLGSWNSQLDKQTSAWHGAWFILRKSEARGQRLTCGAE